VIVPPNQVLFSDAFEGCKADLRYTYTKAGLEQDVIFREQPPTPAQWNLPSTTSLEMWSEIAEGLMPAIRQHSRTNAPAGTDSAAYGDEDLVWPTMRMVQGKAFLVGDERKPGTQQQVRKQLVQVDGRNVLVEMVAWNQISDQLKTLPTPPQAFKAPRKGAEERLASGRHVLPARPAARADERKMLLASRSQGGKGYVLDWDVVVSGYSDNLTLQGDTTYYVTGMVSPQSLTLEGGAVVKFDRSGDGYFNGGCQNFNCLCSAYHPAVFTSMDDDGFGQAIYGSTGLPSVISNCTYWMGFVDTLQYARFAYAGTAITGGDSGSFWNCQFVNCGTAFGVGWPTIDMHNILFANCDVDVMINGGAYGLVIENATADNGSAFLDFTGPNYGVINMAVNNCIITQSGQDVLSLLEEQAGTNGGVTYEAVYQPSSLPYVTCGGGSYYLAPGTLQGQGTTNIDPSLLGMLQEKTTDPPMDYEWVTFTASGGDQTFWPIAQRDLLTSPAPGYHYDPLDYVFSGCVSYVNLTFEPGTAVGWHPSSEMVCMEPLVSISARNQKAVNFQGTVEQPDYLVRANTVQECGNRNWQITNVDFEGEYRADGVDAATVTMQFTHCSVLGWDDSAWPQGDCHVGDFSGNGTLMNMNLMSSEFSGGMIALGGYGIGSATNCLFQRTWLGDQQETGNQCILQNCTLIGGGYGVSSLFTMRDCVLDAGTTLNAFNENGETCNFDYNAFLNGTAETSPAGAHDVMVDSYSWTSGPLGNYYHQAGDPLAGAGDVSAAQVGLYHYTVLTNNVIEGTNLVSLGYHYVALGTNGLPLVSNTNGVPDYLADANGNGIIDPGEIPWYDVPCIYSGPSNQAVIVGSNAVFTVVAGGTPPLNYQWMFQAADYDVVVPITGATNSGYVLSNAQALNVGEYFVVVGNAFGSVSSVCATLTVVAPTKIVAFGENDSGQCDVPSGLYNAVGVAAGGYFSLALLDNGMVFGWGDDAYGEIDVPQGLDNVVGIAAGMYHGVAVLADGSVTNWGSYYYDDYFCSVTNRACASAPPTSGVVAVAAGAGQDLALLSDGTCVAWGYTNVDGTGLRAFGTLVPASFNLTNVSAIACGWEFNATLSGNGAVAAWGCPYPGYGGNPTLVPSDLSSNVVAISAGGYNGMALLSNGTVEAWGDSESGVTDVPAGLSNVIAIATGGGWALALKTDGTLALWPEGLLPLPAEIEGVQAISCGFRHGLILESAVVDTGLVPLILKQPANQYALPGGTVTFSVLMDVIGETQYQWQFNGTNIGGATNAFLTLANVQATNAGSYGVVISSDIGSITSSAATLTIVLPPGITSETPPGPGMVWLNSYGDTLSVSAVGNGGTVFPLKYEWQFDGASMTNIAGPSYTLPNLSATNEGLYSLNVTNAAGSTNMSWNVRWALPGMVEAWGDDDYQECDRPVDLTNVCGIAAGEYQSILVTDSNTVAQWGYYWDGGTGFLPVNDADATQPPASNVVAVAAGAGQALALMTDGTVRAWGWNGAYGTHVPASLTGVNAGVKAIGCGWDFNNALLTNGTVVCWGNDDFGQTDMPAGLNNVTAIATGAQHSLALKSDGTVVAWGYDGAGQTNVPAGLNNVVAVAAGGQHSMALQASGIVVAWGDNGSGQTNVPAGLSNVMAIAGGWAHSVALRNDGTIVEWGDNSFGQTTVPAQTPTNAPIPSRLIAAGGDHTMAAIFCPWVQYPVDVTRDLLLVYNTNSIGGGSSNVCQYYLANRPMVGNCTNVIAVGPSLGPGCWPDDFTNNLLNPIQNWFAANPTRIPTYIILFQDTPSFVVIANPIIGCPTTSVQYQLRTALSATWAPFITSINMDPTGGTNSCIAYINKLASMSSNNPPGTLFISGTAAGYGNTNWYFDDVSPGYSGTVGYHALEGVEAAGVSSNAITYVPFTSTTDIANCTNVAGYFSWGVHANLPTNYVTNGAVSFYRNSTWYLIATDESFNGQEDGHGGTFGDFVEWFSSNAFQCASCSITPYTNTPVGAICHVDEPYACSDNTYGYFGNWAAGKSFAICAWSGQIGTFGGGFTDEEFQAVGDPFVMK
jgi:alpha-tubulin suppressor-like RCC1 family protein